MASIMAIWLTARSCGCVCTSPATCLCGPKRSRSMVKCLWQQWALQDLLHVNIDKTWLSAINKGSYIKAFFTRSICTKPLALAGMEHNVPIYGNKYSVLWKTSTWPISLRRRELGSGARTRDVPKAVDSLKWMHLNETLRWLWPGQK